MSLNKQNRTESSEDSLRSLMILGRILLWTPIAIGFPALVYALITGDDIGPVSSGDGLYGAGMISASGLVTLIYVSIKKFQKARKGTDGT